MIVIASLSNLVEPCYQVVLYTLSNGGTDIENPDHLHYPQQLSPLSSELPQSQGWSCSQTWPQQPRQVMNLTQGRCIISLMGYINYDTESSFILHRKCPFSQLAGLPGSPASTLFAFFCKICGDVMHQPVQKLLSSHCPLRNLSQGANFVAEKRDVC